MVLKDLQRDALKNEITGVIMDNQRTSVIMLDELIKDRSELFVMCWNDYQEQNDVFSLRHPFYVPDERGTFGFMRLRDDDGRVLGYEGNADDDPTDEHYKPTPADKRKITAIMESGTPLYYYIGDQLAVSLGVVLTEYTEPAVYEYERKRHRLFDLTDPNPNNSALYMALYESYFSQYDQYLDIGAIKAGMDGKVRRYDFPTLTAETETRKNYYARLIRRVTNGEISIKQIFHFPHGKGIAPKSGKHVLKSIAGEIRGYNAETTRFGYDIVPRDENEIDLERIPQGLFWHATR